MVFGDHTVPTRTSTSTFIVGKIAKPGPPRPNVLQNPDLSVILQNPDLRSVLQNPDLETHIAEPGPRGPPILAFESIACPGCTFNSHSR